MKTISYKSSDMHMKVMECEIANGALHTAETLLKNVQSHNDWTCSERKTIVERMDTCRKTVNKIAADHDSLLSILKTLDAQWEDAEQQVIALFKDVDSSAKDALVVPANAESYRGNYLVKTLFRYGVIPGFITTIAVAKLGLVPFNAYIWPFRSGLNVQDSAAANQNGTQTNSNAQGTSDAQNSANQANVGGTAEEIFKARFNQIEQKNPPYQKQLYHVTQNPDGSYSKSSGICNISSVTMLLNRKMALDGKEGNGYFTPNQTLRDAGANVSQSGVDWAQGKAGTGYVYSGGTDGWANKTYSNDNGVSYTTVSENQDAIKRNMANLGITDEGQYMVKMLQEHPEGICIRNSASNHVAVITDYSIREDGSVQLYVRDPVNGNENKPLESTWLGHHDKKDFDPFAGGHFISYIK